MDSAQTTKIKTGSLVLMIFSAIFGFSNSLTAYYQMGYSSIIWYVITAIAFFLPSALIFAEYGAAFKGVKGGIFSWLEASTNEKTAFVGTFIWLAAWVVWLVSSTQFFLVSVSTAVFGKDTTQSWHFLGLSATHLLGVLEVVFLVIVTFCAARGVDKIAFVNNIGGVFTLAIAIGFTVVSLLVFIMQGGHLAEPVTAQTLTQSPNPAFQSPIAVLSFIVYALFAYGGLETSSGVIDSVDKPEKTYPRALIIAMVVMTALYVFNIFMCGVAVNWNDKLGAKNVNLANVEYVLINNLGIVTGKDLGLSHSACLMLGTIFSRCAGIADVLSGIAAAFLMVYSPIKSFIEGSDSSLMPASLTKLNKHGMPERSMWVQAIIVSVVILFISFGGSAASQFYTILMDMMNVSSSVPYLFLIAAFPFFKMKKNLDRPFVFITGQKKVWALTIVVWLVTAIGIVFTCIEPLFTGDYSTAFWTAIGPVAFGLTALIYYNVKHRPAAD
ncbi:MAG: glutamate/gamma-aminobutyrate family transporter YjeM [Lactobacillus sp.]|jgi:amino acid transporter|nr:glutamate/gamma-aminobutyrate family transporter YjeM [Lactobacillus sp.]MCH3990346.1 glutamate/gamma-aminobutyrate family transporter YjeM [Lactobacillus sp.]MCH4068939.1 glutamate/gamma-aminobutyrate family transporter YjeM [Lactobacillus sp.]MCI1303341.1 glutamate/gamma-aminobutyrate family transporter YjeM [Lactobacillus sp.]MCI1329417.1 glutamate/gamma-aminobutyrate family transporter YjeM [Lactobacillus sp.]